MSPPGMSIITSAACSSGSVADPAAYSCMCGPICCQTLNPKVTGWFASKSPFAFDVEQLDLREDAYRLMNGTPGIASLHAIQPGVEIVARVGVAAIREKSMRQTALIIDLADEMGYEVVSPRDPERRAGTVTVNPSLAFEVSNELLARDIKIDFRPQRGHSHRARISTTRTTRSARRCWRSARFWPMAVGSGI